MAVHHFQQFNQPALSGVGWVRFFGGNTANGETVTIGTRVYEFSDVGLTVGNVLVNVPNGSNEGVSVAGLVAAINADASAVVDAQAHGVNSVALVGRTPGTGSNAVLSTTVANAVVSGTPMVGGEAEDRLSLIVGSYTLTAADVTALAATLGTSEIVIGAFPFDQATAPHLLAITARRSTSAIVDLADGLFILRNVNNRFWALCYREPAAGALLLNTDIISYVLGDSGF